MLNFDPGLWTGPSALRGELCTLRLCDRLSPMTDRSVLESMIRDQGQTTNVSFPCQDLTSVLDKYVPEWMGKDAVDGLCFHPPRVQSYLCCDLPTNRSKTPRACRSSSELSAHQMAPGRVIAHHRGRRALELMGKSCDVRDLLGPSFSKKQQSSERSCNKVVVVVVGGGGGVNSIWPTKSKMERKMLHQVGRPLQNVSDVAKQIVGLAGHSASPHSTALVLNVSPSTAWF